MTYDYGFVPFSSIHLHWWTKTILTLAWGSSLFWLVWCNRDERQPVASQISNGKAMNGFSASVKYARALGETQIYS